ncbi:flagellar hook-associated protein 2 [Bacillus sp. JJ864]|uniref:flagellar hook-associated protein 2 n=1 Tax=Bacillus sp. JJ864 TaxID=3122975 RepID=UPI002FFEEAF1
MAGTISNIGGKQQIWNTGSNLINVKDLVDLELQALEAKKSPYNSSKQSLVDEKNVYASVKKEFSDFVTAFTNLSSFKGNEKKTSTSKDGFITAEADGSAFAGTYNITVQKLAQRHQITSVKDININDTIGQNGIFKIGDKPLEVKADMTYKDLINKMNNGGYGVTAYTLGTKMFVTSAKAGTEGKIELAEVNGDILQTIGLFNAPNQIAHEETPPQDAEYTINGITQTSKSNTVNALPGVTIKLEKETSEPIRLTVEDSNINAAMDAIKKMTTEYNKAVSKLDLFAGKDGVLQGSSVGFSLQNAMTSMFSYSKGNQYVSSFGIQVEKDGNVKLDEEKLKTAFRENPDAVNAFFFGFNGLGHEIEKKLDGIFGVKSFMTERTKSIDKEIRDLDSKIKDIDSLNKMKQEAIVGKYSKLEQQLAMLDMQLKQMKAMTKQKSDD